MRLPTISLVVWASRVVSTNALSHKDEPMFLVFWKLATLAELAITRLSIETSNHELESPRERM